MQNAKFGPGVAAAAACLVLFVRAAGAAAPEQPKASTSAVAAQPVKSTAAYVRQETYFNLPSHSGGRIDLSDYAGKPVLVVFIDVDCPYCKKAVKFLEKEYAGKYKGKGLEMVTIALGPSNEKMDNFIKDGKLTHPFAFDGAITARKYRVRGVPHMFFINKDHKIKAGLPGYTPAYDPFIRQQLDALLQQ